MKKSGKYLFELTVRGYELDSYGHVNNAVYLNYIEQARWDLFRQLGLLDQIMTSGKKIVIVETNIKYKRQLRLFDEIVVETIMETSAPFLIFDQHLVNQKTNKTVVKARVKALFLDENDKPCDIPSQLLELMTDEQ